MTLIELYAYIRDGGTLAVLLLIIVGGMRRWYVWKWYADEQSTRISQLEARLDRASRITEGATGLASRATKLVEEDRYTGAASE